MSEQMKDFKTNNDPVGQQSILWDIEGILQDIDLMITEPEVNHLVVPVDAAALAASLWDDAEVSDGHAEDQEVESTSTGAWGVAPEDSGSSETDLAAMQRSGNTNIDARSAPAYRHGRARTVSVARRTSTGKVKTASDERRQRLRQRNIVHANNSRHRKKKQKEETAKEIECLEKEIGRLKGDVYALNVDVDVLEKLWENHPCDLPTECREVSIT